MVKAGGRLVYATCSLEPEENDAVVAGYEREGDILRLTPDSGADGFTAFVLRV